MSKDPFAGDAADPFDSATSTFTQIVDYFDRLVLITPLEHVEGIKTEYATAEKPTCDAVDATMAVLDGENAPEEVEIRFFQGPLIAMLKRQAKFNTAYRVDPSTGYPQMKLGRLARGQDKTGKLEEALYNTAADKRPWILTEPTNEDKGLARAYLKNKKAADPFSG